MAQRIAGHSQLSTTKIYDRSRDRLPLPRLKGCHLIEPSPHTGHYLSFFAQTPQTIHTDVDSTLAPNRVQPICCFFAIRHLVHNRSTRMSICDGIHGILNAVDQLLKRREKGRKIASLRPGTGTVTKKG